MSALRHFAMTDLWDAEKGCKAPGRAKGHWAGWEDFRAFKRLWEIYGNIIEISMI